MTKLRKIVTLIGGIACTAMMCFPSHAAESFIDVESVPTLIGIGVGRGPDYRGSDEDVTLAAPFARYTFKGQQRYVQLMFNEASANLVDSSKFQAGPVLNYHFGRNTFGEADPQDPVVKEMKPIDDTIEAGVFGNIIWADKDNPRNRLSVGATLLQDVGGESDGFRAKIAARWWHQVALPVDIHLGAGLIWANKKYNDHYFGVNAGNVGTSALPFYTSSSGVNEYFVTAATLVYLSKEWIVGAGVRFATLGSDVKDSPLVDVRGKKSYVISGVALGYAWH